MGASAIPWRVGDPLAAGWKVVDVQAHAEFVVLRVAKGRRRAGVEIIYHDGAPHPWATERYRVQPPAGEESPVELLAATLETLRELDVPTASEPFVAKVSVPETPVEPPPEAAPLAGAASPAEPTSREILDALTALDADEDD